MDAEKNVPEEIFSERDSNQSEIPISNVDIENNEANVISETSVDIRYSSWHSLAQSWISSFLTPIFEEI
jgi:hypothetical protein